MKEPVGTCLLGLGNENCVDFDIRILDGGVGQMYDGSIGRKGFCYGNYE